MVLDELEKRNKFFTNIYQKGILLYSSDAIQPTDVHILDSATSSFLIDTNHLDHRLSLIEGFLSGARECLSNLKYNACLFMLHQVVEQCCLTLIRAHLGYRSDIHNLRRLLQLCCCFSAEPIKVFLSGTREDDRLFNILLKSYSKTRYCDEFLASKDYVHLLYQRIERFLALTKSMCNGR
nr:HEPN domain-containing protein [Pedobacter panaciterrae]